LLSLACCHSELALSSCWTVCRSANDVKLAGLNHKMGWRGITNTGKGTRYVYPTPFSFLVDDVSPDSLVMSYGENGGATGYLVGEEGRGLACMFAMMNEARVSIGLCASALGYAGDDRSYRNTLFCPADAHATSTHKPSFPPCGKDMHIVCTTRKGDCKAGFQATKTLCLRRYFFSACMCFLLYIYIDWR
jgi:hypothetical protein